LFAKELASEVGAGHALFGLAATPIARADGRDDHLFQLDDGRIAEVHLKFANRPERPPWPVAALFADLEAWQRTTE
jgi:hypothetical protein